MVVPPTLIITPASGSGWMGGCKNYPHQCTNSLSLSADFLGRSGCIALSNLVTVTYGVGQGKEHLAALS